MTGFLHCLQSALVFVGYRSKNLYTGQTGRPGLLLASAMGHARQPAAFHANCLIMPIACPWQVTSLKISPARGFPRRARDACYYTF